MLVLIGLATRIAAIPQIGTMVVALATDLAPKVTGATALSGHAELLYIALLVPLIANGAGARDAMLAARPSRAEGSRRPIGVVRAAS